MNRLLQIFVLILLTVLLCSAQQLAPLGKILSKNFSLVKEDDQILVLISFTDKGTHKLSSSSARVLLSDRAIARRAKVRPQTRIIDEQDLPLNDVYVHTVKKSGVHIRHELKWFNAVSALATKQQIESIRLLPFVQQIEIVGRWQTNKSFEQPVDEYSTLTKEHTAGITTLDYGTSSTQVTQINVPAVHQLGIYGQGIVIGVFDNGFRLPTHEAFASMNIIATYDFVDHKESVVPINTSTGFGSHGVNTLSTVGGYKPGQLIGPAFKADYILARTENDSSETPIEEDNWAKAIEWADSIGVDVTSTSLGYLDYDSPYPSWTWEDMDGNTTLITRACDRAVGLGIVVVNSAGNSGSSTHNTLGAPADGDSVIAAGAVDGSGARVSFSSIGPTTDVPARIKPDIMAMGSGVKVASSTNTTGYGYASGTSFSCPLSAGAAALVLCANPALTPVQVREALRQTANNSSSPNNYYGWGIINTRNAIDYYGISPNLRGVIYNDLNGNGIQDMDETGVAGLLVRISGSKTDSTYTDSQGRYLFMDLSVGSFTISVPDVPSGKTILFPSNSTYEVTIDSTAMVQNGKNFSVVEYSIVHGSVFEDIDGDGTQNAGEEGIPGWTVAINSGFSAVTDSNGNFTIEDVTGGSISLSESLQTGWSQTYPAGPYSIDLGFGEEVSGYHFGVFRNGSIAGLVFYDSNSNGTQEFDEPGLANWKVFLSGPQSTFALTDSSGQYQFSNLTAGVYTISESLYTGWGQTIPATPGSFTVTLTSGLDTADLDFGNYYAPNMIYSVSQGWNLLSFPRYLTDQTLSTVYPTAQSQAIIYQNKYLACDTVPSHQGFWLKFLEAQNVFLAGDIKSADTMVVHKGWNLLGSISDPLPVSLLLTQPDSLLASALFAYQSTGYVTADTILPHIGYWVKTKSDGIIILQSPAMLRQKIDTPATIRKIKY